MIFPTWQVDVAFDDGPFAVAPVWTNITDLVSALSVTRGRSDELEPHTAGTATVTLDNSDGRFDPQNDTGPYFGKLLFNRRIRILAAVADTSDQLRYARFGGRDLVASGETTYPIFDGYIDSWPSIGDTTRDYAEVQLTATDAFRLIAERRIETVRSFTVGHPSLGALDDATVTIGGWPVPFDAEQTGQRADRVLALLGVPSVLRDCDRGNTRIVADQPEGNALEYLQRLETAEGGRFFVAANGKFTFVERRAWSRTASSRYSQATFSDAPSAGDLTYVDGEFDTGNPARVRNVIVRGRGSRQLRAVNVSSVTIYGPLEDAETDLLTESAADLADHASWTLGRFATPVPQWQQLTVVSSADPDRMLPQQLGREVGDRITVERTAKNAGTISADYWIDGIAHECSRFGELVTTWKLTAIDSRSYFTVGDATFGALDTPANVLAW